MDKERIRRLLREATAAIELVVAPTQLEQMATHFALLLKWNARINLTSIRTADEIATRHFGESLFLAGLVSQPGQLMVDIGSGAGFPGLPLKIVWPKVETLLVEANQKKATFLKEVIRACELQGIEVRAERLEDLVKQKTMEGRASLITMRAVAPTSITLSAAASLLSTNGQIALFSSREVADNLAVSETFEWQSRTTIPQSLNRVILLGRKV